MTRHESVKMAELVEGTVIRIVTHYDIDNDEGNRDA